ncbi:MAG: limonene-1,2-epoxide hydrolase family protein [Mycobacterium sp.]
MSAWANRDAAAVGSFFSEDAVYHNVPMDPVRGRAAIAATVAEFMAMGGQVRVDIRHIVAEGHIVMVERVDHFVGSERTIAIPIVGVFEVREGKITAWRDYFDSAHLAGQPNAEQLSRPVDQGL